jgi:hypothetical protein
VAVWGLRTDKVAGQRLGPGDLQSTRVRFAAAADADSYLSAAAPPPEGAVATRDLAAGELLPRSALGAADAVDVVEVPLAVAAEAVPSTVRVGSLVDVWVTGDAVAEATAVLAEVRVLALPRTGSSLGPTTTRQVVVGLDRSRQAGLPLALARIAEGTVVIVRQAGR